MDIDEFQHPDSIWTWGSKGKGKVSLWLPYLSTINKLGKGKYEAEFNGGNLTFQIKNIEGVMIYGASGTIPVQFLDDLATHRVTLLIHRRNMPNPYVLHPLPLTDEKDVLTQQILARTDQRKCAYVARTLIRERLKGFERAGIRYSESFLRSLAASRSVADLRGIEAEATARYWAAFYGQLKVETNRRAKHPLNDALNAGSLFLSGIILRWILFHKLSPSHGFLHQQSSMPALVYDLMEPYRGIIENAAREAYLLGGEEAVVAKTIEGIKKSLETEIYSPESRQVLRRKNLLHGIVLALRAYLLGDMDRLVIPSEGAKEGGRPMKLSYSMPGEIIRK